MDTTPTPDPHGLKAAETALSDVAVPSYATLTHYAVVRDMVALAWAMEWGLPRAADNTPPPGAIDRLTAKVFPRVLDLIDGHVDAADRLGMTEADQPTYIVRRAADQPFAGEIVNPRDIITDRRGFDARLVRAWISDAGEQFIVIDNGVSAEYSVTARHYGLEVIIEGKG